MDTSCEKQKNCWWEMWEKIDIHVGLSRFQEGQSELKWEVKHYVHVLDPNFLDSRNEGSSVWWNGEKGNHVCR